MERLLTLGSIAVLAAAVGIAVSSASAVSPAQTTDIAAFSDSVGEVAGGPDIGTVTASLDGAVLTVEGKVAGMPDVLSDVLPDGAVMFLLNTDSSQATGEMNGADYVLFLDLKTLQASGVWWTRVKTIFLPAMTFAGTVVALPKIGFTLAVKRSDTGAPLRTGRMICDPSYTSIVIKHAESFTGGTAKLAFTVPRAAKGKTLKVKVTIVNGKQSATKVATYKVA